MKKSIVEAGKQPEEKEIWEASENLHKNMFPKRKLPTWPVSLLEQQGSTTVSEGDVQLILILSPRPRGC